MGSHIGRAGCFSLEAWSLNESLWVVGACDAFDFTENVSFVCFGCGSYKLTGIVGAFSLADERITTAIWRLGACDIIVSNYPSDPDRIYAVSGHSWEIDELGALGIQDVYVGGEYLYVGACCDYTFRGDGNLVIPWVGGRVGYGAVTMFGCFNIIWYIVETKPGWNLGACDFLWMHLGSSVCAVGGRCNWSGEVGFLSFDVNWKTDLINWHIGAY